MTEARRPGRPKIGDQQVGRERIVEGVINYIRAGYSDISRREIACHLKITPALITYYFPKGFSLLTEAVGKQAERWLDRIDALCAHDERSQSQKFDQLQQLIISMYVTDAHIVELQTSLWRAGHVPYSLVAEMKKKASLLLFSSEAPQASAMSSFMTSIIWGACEHCVRDHRDELEPHIFNSEELVSGKLVVASWGTPRIVSIAEEA